MRPPELSNSLILIHSIQIAITLRAKENSLILEIESPNGTNADEYPCTRTTDRKNI